MKKLRSLIALFLVMCMLVSFAGCKKKPSTEDSSSAIISSQDTSTQPDEQDESTDQSSDDENAEIDNSDTPISSSNPGPFVDNSYADDESSDQQSTATDVLKGPVSTGKWKQKEFYLSTIWPYAYGATDDAKKKKAIDLCKEGGLNLVELAIGSTNQETLLDYCDEIGMNVLAGSKFKSAGTAANVLWNEAIVRDEIYRIYDHKSVIGYLTWDEIAKDKFETANKLLGLVNKYDPARLAYSCLFPSYGVYNWDAGTTGGNWSDSSYYKYVEDYVKICDPQVLSFDYYPFILDNSSVVNMRDWYRDLGVFRKFAIQYNKPFWYYIGTVDGDEKDNITDAQVRYQLNVSLAYGAKYISYFCTTDYMYDGDTFEKSDRFENAKALNQTAMKMGQFLFDKTGTALYHYGLKDTEYYNDIYFLDDISKSDLIGEVVASDGMIISMFKDANGNEYMMVTTKNLKSKSAVEITLKSEKTVQLLDNSTGKLGEEYKTSLIKHKFIPGEAAIFAIK